MEYGCIARKLGHSFSRDIHARIDDYDYVLREVAPDALAAFMASRDFKGINVTIPYKQDVIPFLDRISETARSIGAVNTIVNRDGKLIGDNTDFGGMCALLRHMELSLDGKKVLILGTGGTSKTARAVASSLGAREIVTVSRTAGENVVTYEDAVRLHSDAQAILNTTPVGMFPDTDASPILLDPFYALEGVMDAVYNPLRSTFVLDAQRRGVRAEGGLYMLVAQAVLAAHIFTGKDYPENTTDLIYASLCREKRSIVLCGMPGCGKTTVGKAVAEKLGRPFVDLDEEIVCTDGREIPEIFRQDGEAAFRDLETRVTARFAQENGLVIATGGGCVLRQENVTRLKHNGLLVFIDRPLSQLLPTADRPTANSAEKIARLYETRLPIYCKAADVTVPSDGVAEHVTDAVIRLFNEENTI